MNPPDPTPTPDFRHDWERRLHAELRQLPEIEAPAPLVANVMAAIQTRVTQTARAWYRRPAPTWPRAWRIVFGVVALGCFALLAWGTHLFSSGLPAMQPPPALVESAENFQALRSAAGAVFDALKLAAQALLTPARLAFIATIIVSQLLLLGLGGAVWRSALRPRAH